MMEKTVSVIIPALNAEKYIGSQIDMLNRQTVKPLEIIVADSQSDDHTVDIVQSKENTVVVPVKRKDFDHGRTRDSVLRMSKGNYVLFLTQDAEIMDLKLIEKLLSGFNADDIAVVTARQLPKKDASERERLIRSFNYPDYSFVRSHEDLQKLGIKTFFMSDVCSMYRKDIYLKSGGFDYPIKTNEDMFYAAKIIKEGCRISYRADACVYHSHNFTLKQQYDRNYIQGYEIERHKDLLENVSQNSEGMKLVKYVSPRLLKRGHILAFLYFGLDCCARLAGSRKGRKDADKEMNGGKQA